MNRKRQKGKKQNGKRQNYLYTKPERGQNSKGPKQKRAKTERGIVYN
jgi:hypothetical protein